MSGLGSSTFDAPLNGSQRTLTFAERVAYQNAIEDVYWRHRIWPGGSPNLKPPLNAVISQAQIEDKVTGYLRASQALEDYWQRPLTAEQLQAEMERMAKNTKQPEVLRDLFEALGNDPFVIAECLARPALAERFLTDWYASDERIHRDLKQRAELDLLAHPTVEQIKQTTGNYTEIELVKTNSSDQEPVTQTERLVKLSSREWDETVHKLAATFDNTDAENSSRFRINHHGVDMKGSEMSFESSAPAAETFCRLPTGKLSPLRESEACYYTIAIIEKTEGHIRLATVRWEKEEVESWCARAETETRIETAISGLAYTLPAISDTTCTANTWEAASMNAPRGRFLCTAVWTGTEMIVWGGYEFATSVIFNTGGRYNPSTNTWIATTNNNAPAARANHTAIWTGSEMIVWGGNDETGRTFNTGGRYNPATNTWTATSRINAPYYRTHHTAVWTGTQMIIWGGSDGYTWLNTGGRYNPNTNTWTATSTTNAPQGRYVHTAVWTGRRMIVWGGNGGPTYYDNLNTGGRYDPSTNTWTAISTINAPEGRWYHTAVWTGSQMIVWGGTGTRTYVNTGGRYNPTTNTWSSTTIVNAPARRQSHTALWTGSDMVVWGGYNDFNFFKTGGRYNPNTNTWTATSTISAPEARSAHTAVWTGAEMIVWGGGGDWFGMSSGGRYNPTSNTWTTTNGNAPTARSGHTAIWTGTEMIVWGGDEENVDDLGSHQTNTGARFSPSTDTWVATRISSAPSPRKDHTAVWTGTKMIVWGGYLRDENGSEYLFNTGGKYDPAANSWTATSTANAPTGRDLHTTIWTGSEMIVWGGSNTTGGTGLNTGGRYNPNTNTWVATGLTNAPSARYHHTTVWSGSEMIVWGGTDYINYFNTGGRYNPLLDTWLPTRLTNAPSRRQGHTAIWTGSEMIVWGGNFWDGSQHYLNTGSRYTPATNSWTPMTITNTPFGRENHTAVWTGSKMIVWGGYDGNNNVNTGGRYNPNTDIWTGTSITNAPAARTNHTAVWTGNEMIVWGGGFGYGADTDTGGRFCVQ